MSTDIIPPAPGDDMLTKSEALTLEREGERYRRTMIAGGYGFFLVLHRLRDGDAHILRGFPNFGDYAADKYEDIEPEYAKKMVRVGAVLAALQDAGKLSGDITTWPKTIGTTGVRALAAVETKHGTRLMLKVYDLALDKATELGKGITKDIVEAALLELAPSKVMRGLQEPEEEEPEEEEPETVYVERGEATNRLLDHIGHLQEAVSDLFDDVMDGDLNGPDADRARASIEKIHDLADDLSQGLVHAIAEQQGKIIDEDAA